MIALLYAFALAAVGIYVVHFGGMAGRFTIGVIAILFFASTVATWLIPSDRPYQTAMFGIDLLSLTLKSTIALCSKRRWPIIIAGFQLNAVCAQTAVFVAPSFTTKFHYAMMTIWAVPTLVVLCIGVALDRRYDQNALAVDAIS